MKSLFIVVFWVSLFCSGCTVSLHDQKNNMLSNEGIKGKTNVTVGVYNFVDKTHGENGIQGHWAVDNIPTFYADLTASVLDDAKYFKSVKRITTEFNPNSAQDFDIIIYGYVNTLKADMAPYAWNFVSPIAVFSLIGVPSAYCYRDGISDIKIVITDPKSARPLDEIHIQSRYDNDGQWCSPMLGHIQIPTNHIKLANLVRSDMNAAVLKSVKGDFGQLMMAMDQESSSYFGKSQQVAAGMIETTSLINSVVKSDIDDLPIVKPKNRKNSYAIVIGIEKYRQKLPTALYAAHDAQTMSEYLTKVLGFPEENVITITNSGASKSDFEKYFEQWLPNNVENGASVFVYYSGHGAPNPKSGDAYLVPYDGDPSYIDQTGYSIKRLYNVLGKLKAKEIVVALDSCFSGAGGKSVLAEGARPLVMNLEKTLVVPQNMVVLSASSGSQISSTYKEKGHGLFTYYLLKGIKGVLEEDKYASLEIGELYDYLRPQVEKVARKVNNTEQVPQLITSQKGADKRRLF